MLASHLAPEPRLPSVHWLLTAVHWLVLVVQEAGHRPLMAASEPPQRRRARQGFQRTSLLELRLPPCRRRPPLAAVC